MKLESILKISQLLIIPIACECISNGYTDDNITLCTDTIVNNKETINVKNTQSSNDTNAKTQSSITEQLDKRIECVNNLIESIYSKDKELHDIIQSFKRLYKEKHGFEGSLSSMSYGLEQKLYNEAIEYIGEVNKYNKKMMQRELVGTIFELEEILLVLKKLKNTDVFPKMVDFVSKNSNDLLNGKVVDFTQFYNEITKNTINNKLRSVLWTDEIITNKLLKEFGLPETNADTNSWDLVKIQVLLMYEALAMCPDLNVEHVLELNSKGKLINGVKINNSDYIYGFLFEDTSKLGICKDNILN